MSDTAFAERLLRWFDVHGRRDLPWQQDTTPYRVWVSEIMLQQTQVNTVIPYYLAFMKAFPSVRRLANAPIDDVLHHWTGLGYYARARNLHKAAKIICAQHNGEFPSTVDELAELPGIGRSTAGAIVAIAFKQRASILDGNVKRVLARHRAIAGWPGQTDTLNALWAAAEAFTPAKRPAAYTQAIMDLGASLCSRSKPACALCPVNADCAAFAAGNPEQYPGKKPKKALPVKSTCMLMIENADGELLLEKRPERGIWGGLWSFPEVAAPNEAVNFCRGRLHSEPAETDQWNSLRHTFSHYHLDITPLRLRLARAPAAVMEGDGLLWYNLRSQPNVGLAAPVKKLLGLLASETEAN